MRRWPIILLAAAAACAPASAGAPVPFSVDARLLEYLAWTQRSARTEDYACLTGEWWDGRMVIDGIQAATVFAQTDSSVSAARCHGRGVVAEWHPHVVVSDRLPGLCEFSDVDRRTFTGGLLVSLLSCGNGEFRYLVAGDTTTHTLRESPLSSRD